MENENSVCAVVVTYNRKSLLNNCLEALKKQTRPLGGIYLIDKASTDGTPGFLLEKGHIGELPPDKLTKAYEKEHRITNYVNGNIIRFHYVRMPENVGGSGGFYEGTKRAYERGYDWLWLMDDDAEAKEDALEKILEAVKQYRAYAGASHLIDEANEPIMYHRGHFNRACKGGMVVTPISGSGPNAQWIEHCSFVSFLIGRDVVKEVGLPDKRFFVYFDDVEYSLRISRLFKILYFKESVIIHKERSKQTKHRVVFKFRDKSVVFKPVETVLTDYFGIRNYWIVKLKICSKTKALCQLIVFLIKNISRIWIFYPTNRLVWTWLYLRGVYDALTNNFDEGRIFEAFSRVKRRKSR